MLPQTIPIRSLAVPATYTESIMKKEFTLRWGDGVEDKITTNSNGRPIKIEEPVDQRQDIDIGADWFEGMMLDIRKRVVNILNSRSTSPPLTCDDVDEISWKVHEEACKLLQSESVLSAPQGGRRRDIGAEIAARSALDIAADFDLPGRGIWERSVSGDLLNLIETIAREYKGRLKPVSFKRRYRLQQGKRWKITPLSNDNAGS